MCLSTVYTVKDSIESMLCEYVNAIRISDGVVSLTDIMGQEYSVQGVIRSIDLVKNIILIDTQA